MKIRVDTPSFQGKSVDCPPWPPHSYPVSDTISALALCDIAGLPEQINNLPA
jgi:hypothetical protein